MTDYQKSDTPEAEPKPRIWYFLQFISLLLMALIGGGMFGVLAISTSSFLFGIDGNEALSQAGNYVTRNALYASRYIQVMATIGTFIFAAVAQLAFMREPLGEGLGLGKKISPTMGLLAILLVVAIQPTISVIADWSLGWKFPPQYQELETQLRQLHEQAVNAQFAFLKDQSALDFIFNLFMMGFLAAFAEEIFFRRVALRILFDFTGNAHASIVIAAALFALAHGQFFYLIPLFLFGLALGYLALWSRTIWLPILAHFANNAFTLTLAYFGGQNGAVDINLGIPIVSLFASLGICAFLLFQIKRREVTD
jgi:membrane protease YdiL (CAAX protease family)